MPTKNDSKPIVIRNDENNNLNTAYRFSFTDHRSIIVSGRQEYIIYNIVSDHKREGCHGLRDSEFVEPGRMVFDICGGVFRLIVKIEFKITAVFIRLFGTYEEYDGINASEV